MTKFNLRGGFDILALLAFGAALASGCSGGPPAAECQSDADCADGSVCEPGLGGGANVCVVGCRDDSQCTPDARCELVVCVTTPCPGRCTTDASCATDADCGTGQVCEPSGPSCGPLTCVDGCRDDAGCNAGEVCEIVNCVTCPCPGRCAPP